MARNPQVAIDPAILPTWAPAAAASLTALSAVAMFANLSLPQRIWQAATRNCPSAVAPSEAPEALIELNGLESSDMFRLMLQAAYAVRVAPAAVCVRALVSLGEQNAAVVDVFTARKSKMGLALLAEARNIHNAIVFRPGSE